MARHRAQAGLCPAGNAWHGGPCTETPPVADSEVALRHALVQRPSETRGRKKQRGVLSGPAGSPLPRASSGGGLRSRDAAPSGRMAQACELAGCRPARQKGGIHTCTLVWGAERVCGHPCSQRRSARSWHLPRALAASAPRFIALLRKRLPQGDAPDCGGGWQRWRGPAGPSRHFARPCSWRSRARFRGSRHLPAHLQTAPILYQLK